MLHEHSVRELVDDIFEEEALAIGGLAALGRLDEEALRRLTASLAVIRDKTMHRIGDGEKRPRIEPHPVVEEFLARLGRR